MKMAGECFGAFRSNSGGRRMAMIAGGGRYLLVSPAHAQWSVVLVIVK